MIIGLAGRVGAGKDLAARLIQHIRMEENGYAVLPIKDFFKEMPIEEDEDGFPVTMGSGYTVDYRDYWSQSEVVSFAHSLKVIAAQALGVHVEDYDSREFKQQDLPEQWKSGSMTTNRDLLLGIGDKLRSLNPNFFVYALFSRLRDSNTYIISDVRCRNEAEAIKARGGVIIKIDRELSGEKHNSKHKTENDLNDYKFDFVVDNNRDSYREGSSSQETIVEFRTRLKTVLDGIKGQ